MTMIDSYAADAICGNREAASGVNLTRWQLERVADHYNDVWCEDNITTISFEGGRVFEERMRAIAAELDQLCADMSKAANDAERAARQGG